MPTSTVLSRVKGEFFPVMAPGLYAFSAIAALAVAISDDGGDAGLWLRFEPLIEALAKQWPLSIGVVFAAYLLGVLLRTIPVNLADAACKSWFKWPAKVKTGSSVKSMATEFDFWDQDFPYGKLLKRYTEILQEFGLNHEDLLLNEHKINRMSKWDLHTFYNYFKITICFKAPDVFTFIQEFEATVRLFSGMFWAGIIGIVSSVLLVVIVIIKGQFIVWLLFILFLIFTSLILVVMFGRQLPDIRGREAMNVYLAYIVYVLSDDD